MITSAVGRKISVLKGKRGPSSLKRLIYAIERQWRK